MLSPGLWLASWTKCGASDVKLEIKDRGQPWPPKDSKPASQNLYLYQIYVLWMLFRTSFFRKTSSPRWKTLTRLHLTDLSRQRFSTTPFPTPLYHTFTTPFSNGSLQHFSAKLLYNTIQPFSTPNSSNTFLGHSSLTLLYKFSTTVFENNSPQRNLQPTLSRSSRTLSFNTSLEHPSTTPLCSNRVQNAARVFYPPQNTAMPYNAKHNGTNIS